MEGEIGIAERRQAFVERQPVAIGHVGVEHPADRDGVGDAGAAGKNCQSFDSLGAVVKADLDARRTRLFKQRADKLDCGLVRLTHSVAIFENTYRSLRAREYKCRVHR